MSRLRQRLVRILGQSRIRLPSARAITDGIGPGDWIQIESKVWRVTRCLEESGQTVFELETQPGVTSAALIANGSHWVLEWGSSRLVIHPDAVVSFSVLISSPLG